ADVFLRAASYVDRILKGEKQEQRRDYRGSDERDGVASMQHAQPGQSTASSSSRGSGSTASGRNEKLIGSVPFSSLAGSSMYLFAIDSPGQSQSLFCHVLEIAEPVTPDIDFERAVSGQRNYHKAEVPISKDRNIRPVFRYHPAEPMCFV